MNRKVLSLLAACCLMLAVSTVSTAAPGDLKPGQVAFKLVIPKAHVHTEVAQGTRNDAAVPGILPVHYKGTNFPGEGQTIVISGHHFSHPAPGDEHGVFIDLDSVRPGDSIYLSRTAGFGSGYIRFIVSSNRSVFCGDTKIGFNKCPAALRLMRNFTQTKVYVVTCERDGHWREIVTAFAAGKQET